MTVSEGAEIINEAACGWVDDKQTKLSIHTVTIHAARKLSKNPIFNLAAHMCYNFRDCMDGVTDDEWIESAKEAQKILRGK